MPFAPHPSARKKGLFFGNADSGERSAIHYTTIECCRRRGINPFDYFRDVFSRLPSATNWTVADLTPENWQKNLAPSRLSA